MGEQFENRRSFLLLQHILINFVFVILLNDLKHVTATQFHIRIRVGVSPLKTTHYGLKLTPREPIQHVRFAEMILKQKCILF